MQLANVFWLGYRINIRSLPWGLATSGIIPLQTLYFRRPVPVSVVILRWRLANNEQTIERNIANVPFKQSPGTATSLVSYKNSITSLFFNRRRIQIHYGHYKHCMAFDTFTRRLVLNALPTYVGLTFSSRCWSEK